MRTKLTLLPGRCLACAGPFWHGRLRALPVSVLTIHTNQAASFTRCGTNTPAPSTPPADLISTVESQRDSDSKPRVARHELPGVHSATRPQPQRGCAHRASPEAATPLGLAVTRPFSQGSSCLATPGWRTQSLRDWGGWRRTCGQCAQESMENRLTPHAHPHSAARNMN